MEPHQDTQPLMQVSADIRRSDLLAFNLYMLPRIKANWIVWGILAILALAVFAEMTGGPRTARTAATGLAFSVVAATAGIAACSVFGLAFALLSASEKGGNLGPRVFTLRRDGFHERTPVNEGLNRWQGISSIRESKNYLFIGINWYLFHIVPARAFASRGEFEKFAALARELWAAGLKSS